jgi:hypothetical protein
MLLRLRKFNIFWVGEGNDARETLHHTRVEGDQRLAGACLADAEEGCRSFERRGRVIS